MLKGWKLQPLDAQRGAAEDCDEFVLEEIPVCLFIAIPGMEWVIDDRLGKGVYALNPVRHDWWRSKEAGSKVLRTGFQVVMLLVYSGFNPVLFGFDVETPSHDQYFDAKEGISGSRLGVGHDHPIEAEAAILKEMAERGFLTIR